MYGFLSMFNNNFEGLSETYCEIKGIHNVMTPKVGVLGLGWLFGDVSDTIV